MEQLAATDPRELGGFVLRGRLGAGGMGMVYLGVTRGGRSVAVKVIRPEVAAITSFRSRFAREVAAAQRVGGFWTASVVAADAEADPPWLATEYIAGPSLRDAVTEAGALPVPAVLAVAAGLAEALTAIHAAGLVHRDLKPGNILLAGDGPRVIDFGIARSFLSETAALTSVIGTPAFMAPEQLRGERLGPPTDVFALGSTLVYATIGRGPFDTGPPDGIFYRVLQQDPDFIDVPMELQGLVADCLARNPADRPTTDQLLNRLAVDAGTTTDPYRGWRPSFDSTPVAAPVPDPGPVPAPAPVRGVASVRGPTPDDQEPDLVGDKVYTFRRSPKRDLGQFLGYVGLTIAAAVLFPVVGPAALLAGLLAFLLAAVRAVLLAAPPVLTIDPTGICLTGLPRAPSYHAWGQLAEVGVIFWYGRARLIMLPRSGRSTGPSGRERRDQHGPDRYLIRSLHRVGAAADQVLSALTVYAPGETRIRGS